VLHHDADDNGHQRPQYGYAISNLGTVNTTIPRGSTMHELVADDVQPVEYDSQYFDGITLHDGTQGGLLAVGEAIFPAVAGVVSAQCSPERIESETIVDQGPYWPRELMEQSLVNSLALIQGHQYFDESARTVPFGFLAAELARVSGVERNPLQDEPAVQVIKDLLGSNEPAQCPMNAQSQASGCWSLISRWRAFRASAVVLIGSISVGAMTRSIPKGQYENLDVVPEWQWSEILLPLRVRRCRN
jgi:hypothetical protein